MNILVIGNGFDLAHDLPTSYQNFLDFIGEKDKTFSDTKVEDEFNELISNNLWVNYFLQEYHNMIGRGENGWIDFENEISYIIQLMEQARKEIINKTNYKGQSVLLNESTYTTIRPFIEQGIQESSMRKCSLRSFDNTKSKILEDLNRLTRALEIYLIEKVENKKISKKLPDIQKLDVNYVLNFNYTDTYMKNYTFPGRKTVLCDYIHGKADAKHDLKSCNLVLGIDEYLEDNEKDKNIEYIQFKKYYQRIYKKTGCKYKDWIKEAAELYSYGQNIIDNCDNIVADIYIVGHSLDITDRDIMKELITMPGSRTTIFYHDEDALGKLITNMVKMIGQEELTGRVYGENATIIFKEQEPAI